MREILKNVREKLVAKYLKNNSLKNYSKNTKKFKPRIKARIRKNKQLISKNIDTFFDWIKGAELIELKSCNVNEDPVRPELDNKFRTSFGRKIYGVKYKKEICAIMCFGFTNDIPKTVKELDLMTKDAYLQSALRDQKVGRIAIVNEVFKKIKKSNHLNRLITLSPLTDIARNFHLRNGAIELQVNSDTQNFEYKI